MRNVNYVSRAELEIISDQRTSDDTIIFLSGPTSVKTPLSLLRTKDVIVVNGAADYLLKNNIIPFIYVLTDVRFLQGRQSDFYRFSNASQFTFVNSDVYNGASEQDKKYLREHCLILKSLYQREKGGLFKKFKFAFFSRFYNQLLIDVPLSQKRRLTGFSKDISIGYCSCHTVAYAAMQIAYTLAYRNIVCSGLDFMGDCRRFYGEGGKPMPSELSKDLPKIMPFFEFMVNNVNDLNIYNLSDNTAINYDVIPYLSADDFLNNRIGSEYQYHSSDYLIPVLDEAVS